MSLQPPMEEGLLQRQTHFAQARRVVVKAGSAVLTVSDGLDVMVIEQLAQQLSFF